MTAFEVDAFVRAAAIEAIAALIRIHAKGGVVCSDLVAFFTRAKIRPDGVVAMMLAASVVGFAFVEVGALLLIGLGLLDELETLEAIAVRAALRVDAHLFASRFVGRHALVDVLARGLVESVEAVAASARANSGPRYVGTNVVASSVG